MHKIIYALPLLIILTLAALFAMKLSKGDIKPTLTEKPAPKFTYVIYKAGMNEEDLKAKDLPSDALYTQDNLLGKTHLVNIFASWCMPCQSEHHRLMKLATLYGLPIIGINYKDKPEDLQRFIDKLGNPYETIAADTRGHSFYQWGVTGMPETFIVDKNGMIRYHYIGIITDQAIEDIFLPLIQQIKDEQK